MDVHLLGPVEVLVGGRPLQLGSTKQRALLVMLALEAERTISTDRLIAGLWGDEAPGSATKMVQQFVSQLRRLLEEDSAEIVTRGRGYELGLGGGQTDVARFEQLLGEDPRAALRLWRGAPLADVADEPFAAAEIRRLEEMRLHAIELGIDADLDAGHHRGALREVERLLGEHPLRERLHAQRMLALYRSGRQAESLEAFREARAVLVEEIGIEPGSELRGLHERVLRQDPELDLPAVTAAARSTPAPPVPRRRSRWPLVALASLGVIAFAAFFVARRDDESSIIGADRIGRLDDDGNLEASYAVGRSPGAVVAGGDSIWIASERDRTVTRVGREDDRAVTVDVDAEPVGLAYADGSLWVADGSAGRVARLDAGTNRVVQKIELPNVSRAITAGLGSVWVASAVGGVITQIDLGAGSVLEPVRVGGSPTALVTSAESLWIASESEGIVSEFDPRLGRIVRTVAVGGAPSALAVGGGALWVVHRANDTISRIDLARGAVTETIPVGRAPVAVAAGEDAVWVANSQSGTLSQIDPETRRVARTVTVGGGPAGLALAGERPWAAAAGDVAAHRGGTLRFGPLDDDDDHWIFDPAAPDSLNLLSQSVLPLLYDGLVGYRRVGGTEGARIVANLAETVPAPGDDGRSYTFRLRRNLRYADGRPVRASDFRASLERALRLNEGVRAALARVVGVKRCTDERCDLSEGVLADDTARTLVIRLRAPEPELLHVLSHPFAVVLPGGGRSEDGPPLPGTGPYRWERNKPDGTIRLERNPRFSSWSQDARPTPFADAIELVKVGNADLRLGVAPQDPAELRKLVTRYGGRLRADPMPMTQWVGLNVRRPPFDDARVRHALNYAVDRQRVVQLVGGAEGGEITCRYLPLGYAGHRPLCPFTRDAGEAGSWRGPDLDRARELIRASGTRGARVELWTLEQFGGIGAYLRDLLRDLGYRASLRVFDDARSYFDGVIAGKPSAAPSIWFADTLASSNFIQPNFTCGGEFNFSGLCDRRLDALTERAFRARDPATADVLWDRVERRLTTLAPAVPLLHGRRLTILGDRAGNVQNHPLWGPLLDQVWVR